MRGFLLLIAVAFAVPMIASSAQTPSPKPGTTDKKQPPLCTVSGRVVTAADGAPIKSARVALVEESAEPHPHVFAAFTDNDGRFEIQKINPARYEFVASHTGYINQRYQAKGTGDGAILALVPGQEVAGVLFRLLRGAVINGRVIDEAGEPMQAVTVSVLRKPSDEEREEAGPIGKKLGLLESSSAFTDDRGEYRIFGLKPGEYYIKAAEMPNPPNMLHAVDAIDWAMLEEFGSQYAPLFYPGVVQLDQAQAMSLHAGEEMQADFTMRHIKTVQISGRVIAADGGPATKAYVDLSIPWVNGWSQSMGSGTDAKGEFSIKGVPPGSYILSARQHDQDKLYVTRQKLEVGEEKLDSVTIAFGRGTNIAGRILGTNAATNPPERIRVSLSPTDDDNEGAYASAEVKKDGSFQFNDVADGGYALHVGVEEGWFVKSARLGGEDMFQKGVQVEKGAAGGSLEIVLSSEGAQLAGTVTDRDKGQPVAGAQVSLKLDPETPYNRIRSHQTSTDQNGQFNFRALPAGKYRVTAKLPSATPEVPAIRSEPQTITLSDHEHQALQIKLALPETE